MFYIAAGVGMLCLEVQAWARWLTDADAKGYMKNDEAFLARLSRKQVSVFAVAQGSFRAMRVHCVLRTSVLGIPAR